MMFFGDFLKRVKSNVHILISSTLIPYLSRWLQEYPASNHIILVQILIILVEENSNLSTYDIDLNDIGTRYVGWSIDKHDWNEFQKFKIVTWSRNKATIDIEWENNAVHKWYKASLGDVLKLSYNNDSHDLIEFENAEDYKACKVNKYARKWKTGKGMIYEYIRYDIVFEHFWWFRL